jgi:nucleoside-diphosphate-sugar epimerase
MVSKRVLITGGAGYLGGVITRHLLEQEGRQCNRVTWLDSLRYGQQSPLQFIANESFTFIHGDARDKRLLRDLIPKYDAILPLAAIVGAPACDLYQDDARTTNHEAVVTLNELRSKGQMLIYPTTNSGYGTTTAQKECTEDSPLNPISLYGTTKADAERALLEDSKSCIAFRFATVFGMSPRPRLDLLVNDLTYRALAEKRLTLFEKHFMRNFVHIHDVARVFQFALSSYETLSRQRLYNVGNPDLNISKEQLVSRIASKVEGVAISEDTESKDPDQRNYIVSNQRLLKTGFLFTKSLDYGIQEIIDAYPLLKTKAIQRVAYNNQRLA